MNTSDPVADAILPSGMRLLKWHERVMVGDFVKDGRTGFVPWEGPHGFRADAFVKQIFRRRKSQPLGTKSNEDPETDMADRD